MSVIIPFGERRMCDRCCDEFPVYPRGQPTEAARISMHTNYNPSYRLPEWGPMPEHGGLPEGNLCPSCLFAYTTWWTAGGKDDVHAAEKTALAVDDELEDEEEEA